jgi:carbon monoxide dehydrogenase subunit G
MRVEGTRSFAAPRETVWEVLNDPARMAELMPGVESFDVEDDRNWRANVKIPLGLGGLRMSINFEKIEERKPDFARLNAKGTGVGALMSMTTEFNLSEQDGGTAMQWAADVRIAGPVGSMGQRVLQPIVNQQVQSVLTALDKQVAAAAPEAAGRPAEAPGSAPVTDPELKTVETPSAPVEGPMHGGLQEPAGTAGTPEPSTEAQARTDPQLKDYGPAAEVTPDADAGAEQEGSSGAEEGLSPWDEEAYSGEPEGPSRPDREEDEGAR